MKNKTVFLLPMIVIFLLFLPMNLQGQGGGVGTGATVCIITIEPPCTDFVTPSVPCAQSFCITHLEWDEDLQRNVEVFGCDHLHERLVVATSVRKVGDAALGHNGWNVVNGQLPDKQCAVKKTCDCDGKNENDNCEALDPVVHDPAGDVPQEEAVEAVANQCIG